MRDPYAVLGVAKSATAAEVKSAYRRAAKKHHPDQNPGDKGAQARFAELNQAYEVLGDPAKRSEYDQGLIGPDGKPRGPFGAGGGSGPGAGGFPGGNPFEGFPGFGGGGMGARAGASARDRRRPQAADDILTELFGTAFNPSQERRKSARAFTPPAGNDINITRETSLEDIAAGRIELALPTGRTIAVKLPQGVTDGQVIRLKEQGYSSPAGGQPGDANITIRFRQESRRRIEGTTVTIEAALPFDVAVLGGKLPVDTPDGRIALTIPPMTDGDRTFRLKGRGLAGKDGEKGDLLVSVRIMLPSGMEAELAALAVRARGANGDA
jgi:DnaJ-class molecular chaperone